MREAHGSIAVVGLGSGDEGQLTLGIWQRLSRAARLRLRTEKHPVVRYLAEQGIAYRSFDALYEAESTFESVYERIAAALIDEASSSGEEVVYAVPGHPQVAEYTVKLLRERCSPAGVELRLLGGESFLDQAFLRLGFDPIEGFALLDATALKPSLVNPGVHTIVAQVFDKLTASDVKLTLMEKFPDDYPVTVCHALGVIGEERIETAPLYELDRLDGYGNLSLIWIPPAEPDHDAVHNRSFDRLQQIVDILRSPNGCPWDREQTHRSIRNNLIEETYEVLETIDDDDPAGMREELGDLLLQIMLHAQMEAECGVFTVYDVVEALNEKLIRRHPHVFGDRAAGNADEALANWQAIKDEEKRRKGVDVQHQSVLAGVPRDLPGVMKAWKLQKKAAKVGFDWDRIEDVYAKIAEEIEELREASAIAPDDPERTEKLTEELGDLLFAVVNLSRFLQVDPEEAIARTNRKFVSRFNYIEEQLRIRGRKLDQTGLTEMEELWQEAKKV